MSAAATGRVAAKPRALAATRVLNSFTGSLQVVVKSLAGAGQGNRDVKLPARLLFVWERALRTLPGDFGGPAAHATHAAVSKLGDVLRCPCHASMSVQ